MTTTLTPFADLPPSRRRILGRWIGVWAVMVILIVVIGGITRLTESGLSITEWAPITGIVPPLSEGAWQEAFLAYQQIPEYQQLNRGMTLEGFKQIYFWEWFHRAWARLVGLVLAAPLVFFWLKGWLTPKLRTRLVMLLMLTGAQGALGWIMVVSGLTERTDVSQYRLAAHLAMALVIYVVAVWTASDLLGQDRATGTASPPGLRRLSGGLTILVFVTAIAGAFVAGIDGGMAYNTFPLMGGRFIPGGYLTLAPAWRNLFENVAAVQFNHRWIGMTTLVVTLIVWYRGRAADLDPEPRRWRRLLPWVVLAQVGLGITTLLLAVPIPVAALHQTGAVALLTVSLLYYQALSRQT